MIDKRIENIERFLELKELEKQGDIDLDHEKFKLLDNCNHDISVFFGGEKKYYNYGKKVYSYLYGPCKCLFCGDRGYNYDFFTIDLSTILELDSKIDCNEKYEEIQLLALEILKRNPNLNNTELIKILRESLQERVKKNKINLFKSK